MGTRNLSLCKINNEIKVKQYGQWDGYPSGQGTTILRFCQDKEKLEKLRLLAPELKNLDMLQKFIEDFYNSTTKTAKQNYYVENFVSRDLGGEIFENIIKFEKDKLPDEMNGQLYLQHYKADKDRPLNNYCDLWIEYAYLIDFDNNTLDCYGYGDKLKSFDLNNLPTEEIFIKELGEEEL